MKHHRSHTLIVVLFLAAWIASPSFADSPNETPRIDLSRALIVAPSPGTIPEKTVTMLQEEIDKRSDVRLQVVEALPATDVPAIVLGARDAFPGGEVVPPAGLELSAVADAYALWVDTRRRQAPTVYLVGHDGRGALFAVGRLLRLLELRTSQVKLDPTVSLARAPRDAIRGHQMGYRNTANTYDAWDLEIYEQYIRDLILFGTNAVEIIEEGDVGAHLKTATWKMNAQLTRLIKSYGLDVWLWEPLRIDVRDPVAAQRALDRRLDFYSRCTQIDHVMVPGGDPGDTHPQVLFPWLKRHAEALHKIFPDAGIWVSHQKFDREESAEFFRYLSEEEPEWLRGVVYGPGAGIALDEMRRRTPRRYTLRRYPDITHNVRCQYPIPGLDGIFAQTLGREGINPRPRGTAVVYQALAHLADGFVSYSDGSHDDLNKMIWSQLAWEGETDVNAILRDYGRVFFGEDVGEDVASGLWLLEKNLDGLVLANDGIDATLDQWLEIERRGGAELSGNWRFQMYLFRAIFDAYIRARHVAETRYEDAARAELARAREVGVEAALSAARAQLSQADEISIRPVLRHRMDELGPQLFASIGFQFSVDPPYHARNPERGALLDKVDRPLNDRPWLEDEFRKIVAETDRVEQLARIDRILNWDDPGPGGFYDDLGNTGKQPHLVRQISWDEDPGFIRGPQEAHYRSMDNSSRKIIPYKLSWLDYAQTLGETPLLLRYGGLDPKASYRLRITQFGRYSPTMRLTADGEYEIHGPLSTPRPIVPVEFDVPQAATADGTLELRWDLIHPRGCQVAEVWLMRKDASPVAASE